MGVARGVCFGAGVGVGEGEGVGRGVAVNDGIGRGVKLELASGVGSGVGVGASAPRSVGRSARPAPATIAAPIATTRRIATAFPTAVELDLRTMTVGSRGGSIGSVGSLIGPMLPRRWAGAGAAPAPNAPRPYDPAA